MGNIVCINPETEEPVDELFQWDRNVTIGFYGFDTISKNVEVHFSNDLYKDSIVVIPKEADIDISNKRVKVKVPNVLLRESRPLYIYIYDSKLYGNGTIQRIRLPVIPRAIIYEIDKIINRYVPEEPKMQTEYTLFLIDGVDIDPKDAYRYTYPVTSVMNRKDGLDVLPDTFAPLIKNWHTQAWKLYTDKMAEYRINNDYYNATFLLTGDSIGIHKRSEWDAYISDIEHFFAPGDPPESKKMLIIDSEDKSFYRIGQVTATLNEIEDFYAIITIRATFDGKKYERYHSAEPWIWDDFKFTDGIIRNYNDITVSHESGEYMTLKIPVRTVDIIPEFKRVDQTDEDDDIMVSIDGTSWSPAALESYDAIDGIVLNGAVATGTERELYLKGNEKHISIRMRVATDSL